MVIFDIIVEVISAIFFRKGKKKKTSANDGLCPTCETPVILSDEEKKDGRFICKNCGSQVENTRLK